MASPDALAELMQKFLLFQQQLSAEQKERDEKLKERDEKQRERDEKLAAELKERDEKLKERDEKLAAELKERDEKQKERDEKLAAELKERDEKLKERDEKQRERDEKNASILAALASPSGLSSPSTTAQLGHRSSDTLEGLQTVSVLERSEGPSILTSHQKDELAALMTEDGNPEDTIVRYIAPLLLALRLPGASEAGAADPTPLAIVSSESHAWLVHPSVKGVSNQRLKPDLFLTWAPFVDVRNNGQGFPRGLLASPALQKVGCVAEVYEAKSKALTKETFGQQCLYNQCFPGKFKSALFNHEQCWLLETMHSHPVRLLKLDWTTPGSARALQNFMGVPVEPPLLQLLRRVLVHQQLATLSIAGRCHLGSGASGHVFAVNRTSDAARTPLALKLVLDAHEWDLHGEFARMQAAAAAGAPVVAPVDDSLCIYSGGASAVSAAASAEEPAPASASGGYLLSRVGERFATTTEGGIKMAFSALAALHACRIFHGDARTANLLNIEGQAMWIDLRTGLVDAGRTEALPHQQQRYDAAVLARSILPQLQPLPSSVQDSLNLYDSAVPGTELALARKVWEAL